MANPTMQLIASQIVGSGGASSITFSSIPQTYTDLLIKTSARANVSAVTWNYKLTLNGTSSSYASKIMYGSNTTSSSFNGSNSYFDGTYVNGSTATSNTFNNNDYYIPNYTGSNYKILSNDSVAESNQTATILSLQAALWSFTNAITSISFAPESSGSFVQYSSFYLYGINNS
jgi:hypothetical protein